MSSIYIILGSIASVLLLLGIIVGIIEKKLIFEREIEYSKSINLTEIRNQIKINEKKEDTDNYYEPVIIETKSLDEKIS